MVDKAKAVVWHCIKHFYYQIKVVVILMCDIDKLSSKTGNFSSRKIAYVCSQHCLTVIHQCVCLSALLEKFLDPILRGIYSIKCNLGFDKWVQLFLSQSRPEGLFSHSICDEKRGALLALCQNHANANEQMQHHYTKTILHKCYNHYTCNSSTSRLHPVPITCTGHVTNTHFEKVSFSLN